MNYLLFFLLSSLKIDEFSDHLCIKSAAKSSSCIYIFFKNAKKQAQPKRKRKILDQTTYISTYPANT